MRIFFVILLLILNVIIGYSQNGVDRSEFTYSDLHKKTLFLSDSLMLKKGECKGQYEIIFLKKEVMNINTTKTIIPIVNVIEPKKKSLLKIHGNVQYNFNYRSYLDTPFVERDLMQHSVQTRLDLVIKNKYPLTVFFTHRNSNSAYFLNASDINVQFRQTDLIQNIKNDLKHPIEQQLSYKILSMSASEIYEQQKGDALGLLDKQFENKSSSKVQNLIITDSTFRKQFNYLYNSYKRKRDQVTALQQWVNNPMRIQEMIEEKERKVSDSISALLNKKKPLTPLEQNKLDSAQFFNISNKQIFKGILTTSDEEKNSDKNIIKKQHQLDSSLAFASIHQQRKQDELNILKKELLQTENSFKLFQKKYKDSLQQLKQQLLAANSKDAIDSYIKKTKRGDNYLSPTQKILLSVTQFGIGRTWMDYSDLTVKNISLNGVNVELNPNNIYIAGAIGKVNYRFRDFVIKGDFTGNDQSLALIRMGYGRKEGNHLIATYYAGQKALLNQRGAADSMAVKAIVGFSLAGSFHVDANNYLMAEFARSSVNGAGDKVFDFKRHSNEAWTIKTFSDYRSTHTKVTAFYRKMGEGFQSFTLYPTNSNQEAWSVKVKQGFYKQKLQVEVSIRKNDFNSPIASPDFSSATVFKSFQVTARFPKYPLVTVGFYPSSQLTMSNTNVLYEQQFNTLNAIINHNYFISETNVNTSVVYTRFYNSSSDTGFIYYNASSCIVNHSIYKGAFIFQGIFTLSKQKDFIQRIIEPIVTYQLKNRISFTGSIKWSDVNKAKILWGGMAGLNMLLKGIGNIQLQYDKSYLPGYDRNLLPVSLGRLTFTREF